MGTKKQNKPKYKYEALERVWLSYSYAKIAHTCFHIAKKWPLSLIF